MSFLCKGHLFQSTGLTKSVPTYCDECKSLCWIMQKLRRCSHCDTFLHEECFKKRIAAGGAAVTNAALATAVVAAAAAPATVTAAAAAAAATKAREERRQEYQCAQQGQQVQGAYHVHSLVQSNAACASRCALCNEMILKAGLGTSERYMKCVGGCDPEYRAHVSCFVKKEQQRLGGADAVDAAAITATIILEEEYTKKVKAEAASYKERKGAVVTGVIDLLKALDARNSKWGQYTWSPLTIYNIQKKQSEVYKALADEIPDSALVPVPVLDHLVDVLRFATAAYAAAFEDGAMNSAARNLLLHTVQREKLVNARPEQNAVAVANLLSVARSDVLVSYFGNDISEPTFMVVDDRANKRVVLAFRGSITEADFLTDALGELAPLGVEPAAAGGFCGMTAEQVRGTKAHRGILGSIRCIFDPSHKLYLVERLRGIMRARSRDTMLCVTGHSLGGGLTLFFSVIALLTDCLAVTTHEGVHRSTRDQLQGYAFAPPPVITNPLASLFDESITSVVCAKDCVPRLQIPAADRLGVNFVVGKKAPAVAAPAAGAGAEKGDAKQPEEPAAPAAGQELGDAAAAELAKLQQADVESTKAAAAATPAERAAQQRVINEFLEKEARLVEAIGAHEECNIPGKIIFTSSPTHNKAVNSAHFINRESPLLHTVWLSQHMIDNHLMQHYALGLLSANRSEQHQQASSDSARAPPQQGGVLLNGF